MLPAAHMKARCRALPQAGTLCVPSAARGHRAPLLGHGSGGAPGCLRPGGVRNVQKGAISAGAGGSQRWAAGVALLSHGDGFRMRLRRGEGRIQPQHCPEPGEWSRGVWGLQSPSRSGEGGQQRCKEPTQRGWSWGCVGAGWSGLAPHRAPGAGWPQPRRPWLRLPKSGTTAQTRLETHGARCREVPAGPWGQQPRSLPACPLGSHFPRAFWQGAVQLWRRLCTRTVLSPAWHRHGAAVRGAMGCCGVLQGAAGSCGVLQGAAGRCGEL